MNCVLVFPPLVISNFGQYFPSTAVLAASMVKLGASVRQIDLNQKFLNHSLSLQQLTETSKVGGADQIVNSAYARVALCRNSLFYNEIGQQKRLVAPAEAILKKLVLPYEMDEGLSVTLQELSSNSLRVQAYRKFLDGCDDIRELVSDSELLGISVCMGPQLFASLVFLDWLSTAAPTTRIVLGGPVISLMSQPDLTLLLKGADNVDCVVRFEGEVSLAALLSGWPAEQVPNAVFLRDGKLVMNLPTTGPMLDSLPLPDYDESTLAGLASPALGIQQARGCYWGKCAYCDFIELYKGSPRFRGRSPEKFVDEIEFQSERYGVSEFVFITESIPPAFARRVSHEILRRDLKIAWSSFVMVDQRFDVELFMLMKQAGCGNLVVGLETMTDRVLKLVKKAATRELNISFLKAAHVAGLSLTVNLIPNLPTTTRDEALASLQDLRELKDCLGELSLFPFEATASSEVGRNPQEYSLTVETDRQSSLGQAQFSANNMAMKDPGMNSEDRQYVFDAFQRFVYEHNSNRLAKFNIEAEHLSLTQDAKFLDFYEYGGLCHITNTLTHKTIAVPKSWKRILQTVCANSSERDEA